MLTVIEWLAWQAPLVALVNLGMAIWWAVMIRRVRRLEFLLGHICIEAHNRQHMPYWKVWMEVFGYHIDVRVVHRKAEASDDA